jgi:hypothetical protein
VDRSNEACAENPEREKETCLQNIVSLMFSRSNFSKLKTRIKIKIHRGLKNNNKK